MRLNLETAVGDSKLTQPFNSESFPTGGPFTIWECGPPVGNDSELKSCITLPSRTAVSRIIRSNKALFGGKEKGAVKIKITGTFEVAPVYTYHVIQLK